MTRHSMLYVIAIPLLLGLAACDDDSPTSPSPATLTAEVRAALDRSIQDEYRFETTYQGVINDLGQQMPFVSVLAAEQRHSATIAEMFAVRGLTPPANAWTLATVPRYSTITEACREAAAGERSNVAMYDELLRLDLPSDVRLGFTNLRAASLLNHLPAFEACS